MVGSLTMRHSATAAICVLALAITTMPLNAQTSLTLDQEAPLRAKPNSKSPIIARAPAGATIIIEDNGDHWSQVDFDGRRFYVMTAQLNIATTPPQPTATDDPTCDYNYPYSGSNIYFDRPLAKLRHSEPFGFLFGFHKRAPC